MSKKPFHFMRSKENYKMLKKDFIIVFIITLLYACIALFNLGDREAPETEWYAGDSPYIVLDMGKPVDIGNINYYVGNYSYFHMSLTAADNDKNFDDTYFDSEINTCFSWQKINIGSTHRYIRLLVNNSKASFREIVITDKNGRIITPVNASSYANLFDEQNLYKKTSTFRDSTYFDEIYHARTAYEYIHKLTTYENTHPPLGKIFISLGIRAFGMNPFGWRIAGTLFGILMVPIIYLFAKKMFQKTWLCSIICLLFSFDFMHFAQTRISTIDVYVTFFIILMYYFMYRYLTMSFYDTTFKKTLIPLGLCGLSMGLGVSCKWTGCYAGMGLAVLFFYSIIRRYIEYRYAKKDLSGETDGIKHEFVVNNFRKYTIITLLCCVVFFIIIPAIIYTLSYIPFVNYGEHKNLIARMLENQTSMFNYHTTLVATHQYSSHWYQWPTLVRPIFFYSASISSTVVEGISSFGNPAVWWIGIPATSIAVYHAIANNDKKAQFLLLGYAAQMIPWILVPRYTFIYHYFPSTPFVVLIIGYCIYKFHEIPVTEPGKKKIRIAAFIYCGIAIILFIMFYPVISGYPVNRDYVITFLRWFKTWTLVQ